MANSFNLACPSCKDTDNIDIAADVFVRLTPDGTDCDLSRNGDHEWGDDSPANCECGWVGTVHDLIPDACECDNTHAQNGTVCRRCHATKDKA